MAKMAFSVAMNSYSAHPVSTQDRVALLRLARTRHVGPISFFHLMRKYQNAQEAIDRLPSIARRSELDIPSVEDIQREIDMHDKKGWHLISCYDPLYPAHLKALRDAPPFISAAGCVDLLNKTRFAIVGSRTVSEIGQRMTEQITERLTEHSWVIVSGLASGVDRCAHLASIDKGGTIAVLAGGLGHIYPTENKDLYHAIAEKGLLVSEDPLGMVPQPHLFSKRNRLISGLSWGVLVVEASLRSGSLLTAKFAADQGRTIFAVPGHPLDFRLRGTNKLIKQGACLVQSADDILEEYSLFCNQLHEPLSDDTYEVYPSMADINDDLIGRVRSLLSFVPTSVQDIAQRLDQSPIMVRIALVEMEINGEVDHYPGDCVLLSAHTKMAGPSGQSG